MNVTLRIIEARKRLKMTQDDVGKFMGMSRRRYMGVEKGVGRVSLEELGILCRRLGLVVVVLREEDLK